MQNKDLNIRIQNTAKLLEKFSNENLSRAQSGEVIKQLPHYNYSQIKQEEKTNEELHSTLVQNDSSISNDENVIEKIDNDNDTMSC